MTADAIGSLKVVLGLDTAQYDDGFRRAGANMQAFGRNITGIGAGLTAGLTAPLVALGAVAVGEAGEMRDAMGQVQAALTSMGDVAGRSLDDLKVSADALAGASLFEDDEILRGVTANLLTFGNVAGEQFDRAQQAAVDLATRMKMDLQSATVLVGKALNDPIKGMTALGRAGIQLSDDQKALIESMAATGDMAGAQSILLAELERQFGGSAAAARENAPPMERVRLAFADMAGSIGELLLPALDSIAGMIEGVTGVFANMSAPMQQFAVAAGVVAAAIGPVMVGLGALISAGGAITAAFGAGGGLAFLLPFLGPIAIGVAAVTAAFVLWGDDIIPMLQAFGKQLADVIGPKIKPLFDAFAGLASSVGAAIAGIFGAGGSLPIDFEATGRVIAQVFGAAVDLITGAVNVITNIFRALGALLRGDFSTMWNALGSAVGALVTGVLNAFETLFPGVIGSVQRLVEGVRTWLTERLGAVLTWVIDKAKAVGDAFFQLYDRVVGHSYIPDMVDEVGQHIGRLQGNMVAPIEDMTAGAADAFAGMSDTIDSTMEGLFRSIGSKDWSGIFKGVFDLIGQFGGAKIKPWADIGGTIADIFGGRGGQDAVSSIMGSLKLALPGFKDGATCMPSTYGGIA